MPEPGIRKVLIVGGGIAGLTAGAALAQRGIEADIVEIKAEHSVFGVGIIQPGNALRALASIGVAEQCRAAGFQTDEYKYFDADENELATLRMLRIADPDRPAANFLPRAELHRILVTAARDAGARLTLGTTVDTFEQKEDGAHVTLTDGRAGRYDLVIGADGIRSPMRTRLFGRTEPRYTGHGCWRAMVPRPARVDYQALFMGVGVKAGLVPLGRDVMYLLLVSNEPGNPWMDKATLHTALRERMRPFRGPLLSSVRDSLVDPSSIVYVPIEEIILASPWYLGRTILIGDAAHASSPHVAQGASMAIEDAIVLAEEAAKPVPVDQVLAAWAARRYPRCNFVQNISRETGDEGQIEDEASCRARNEAIRRKFATPQPRPHELVLQQPI